MLPIVCNDHKLCVFPHQPSRAVSVTVGAKGGMLGPIVGGFKMKNFFNKNVFI